MILIALGGLSEESLLLLLGGTVEIEQWLYSSPHAQHAVAGERKAQGSDGYGYIAIRKHSMYRFACRTA
ncbi:MAG: hypothetical protein AL399_04935 [Candidatus [Bacteroides] periocalifornicus]|uniref:Uncharacterized protein n=1 Tax=Candidatus [Bacteroides] periocalifornicus TaxID=1702214 RepID=A0A0Q4B7W2_9BACT|nr:MAG: hypothetical protein AL399_04935 [Candidatus [Bacteroides] periocalifornicus]